MNNLWAKTFIFILAGLAVIASVVMYALGSSSGHLTELKALFWIPLPLAALLILLGLKKES